MIRAHTTSGPPAVEQETSSEMVEVLTGLTDSNSEDMFSMSLMLKGVMLSMSEHVSTFEVIWVCFFELEFCSGFKLELKLPPTMGSDSHFKCRTGFGFESGIGSCFTADTLGDVGSEESSSLTLGTGFSSKSSEPTLATVAPVKKAVTLSILLFTYKKHTHKRSCGV